MLRKKLKNTISLKNLDEVLKNKNSFKKTFINYFSLGYEARVGFGFDKSRSSSRCWNKCIYFWEGMKKNCCTSTVRINSIIEKFEEIEEDENLLFSEQEKNQMNLSEKKNDYDSTITSIENKMRRNIIFQGKEDKNFTKNQIESKNNFKKFRK